MTQHRYWVFPSLFLALTSCGPQMAMRPSTGNTTHIAMEEMRTEISDLKHALHAAQVEVHLVEERLREQEKSASSSKNAKAGAQDIFLKQITLLEGRINHIESILENTAADLKKLNATAMQNSHILDSHEQRLNEVANLKSTLTSISQAIKTNSVSTVSSYKVKSGDSLEKIARAHHITTEALKKANQLSSDRIIVGQELKIPSSE
jgi:LysM repeat protein